MIQLDLRLAQHLGRRALASGLLQLAADVVQAARPLAPVKTGRLRRGLDAAVIAEDRASVTVGIGGEAPYTPFQEYGTRHGVPPVGFVRRALTGRLPAYGDYIARAWDAATRRRA